MSGLGDTQARANREAGRNTSARQQGVCLAVYWNDYTALVNINGGEIVVPVVNEMPQPGERVWVGTLGSYRLVLGVVPKPSSGTVTTIPALGKVAVLGDDGRDYVLPYLSGYEPAVDDRVLLHRGVVLGDLASEVVVEVPEVPPTVGGGSAGSQEFAPTFSGTWRGGNWKPGVATCSDSNTAVYGYGPTVRNTVPAGSVVKSTRVFLSEDWNNHPGADPVMGLHNLPGLVGAPGLFSTVQPVPGGGGWLELPASFGQALVNGTATGIGAGGSGWVQWGDYTRSGGLLLEWS